MSRLKLVMLINACFLFIANFANAEFHSYQKGEVLAEYERLMQLKCDLKKFVIHSPIEARILRNIPFARLGYKFSSPDLTLLFSNDGTWYQASTSQLMQLKSDDQTCVERLKEKEAAARKLLKIDPEIEQVLTGDAKIFMALRQDSSKVLFQNQSPGKKTADTLEWSFIIKSPMHCGGDGSKDQKSDCPGASVYCERPQNSKDWRDYKCSIVWAG